MKLAVAASLVASAAAFAPAKQASSSSAVKAFENELGAQPPLGFFDPLGLVADGDQEKFDRLRGVGKFGAFRASESNLSSLGAD
jgi:hypothetical protein